jgi:KDO2-lipid IV(A) lauroyltransferase
MKQVVKFLIKPQYWLLFGLLLLLALASNLSYARQLKLGRFLGKLLYLLPSRIKKIAAKNIALCWPELDGLKQRKLLKENFANIGMGIMETAMAWWLPESRLLNLLEVTGFDYVTQELARGRGVILLSQHFLCLELIGRLMGQFCSFNALYLHNKNPLIAFLLKKYRSSPQVTYIPNTNLRLVIKALHAKQIVWYAYDVDGGNRGAVFAPFFGIAASSLTAVSRLAALSNAAVVPAAFYRCPDDSGYRVIFSQALADFPSADLVADAGRLNQIVENVVRQHAAQYLWGYKRFKTRPMGENKLYD